MHNQNIKWQHITQIPKPYINVEVTWDETGGNGNTVFHIRVTLPPAKGK